MPIGQMRQLDEVCLDWLELAQSNAPSDHVTAANAINFLYKIYNLKPPLIFWCQSPWQMVTMPIVLQLVLRSKLLRTRLKKSRLKKFDSLHDSQMWHCLWNQIEVQLTTDFELLLSKSLNRDAWISLWTTSYGLQPLARFSLWNPQECVNCDYREGKMVSIRGLKASLLIGELFGFK
jgi:hypothetical protein